MYLKKTIKFGLFILTVFSCAVLMTGCAGSVVVRTAPPPLPIYEQPYCPGDGYIWVPGYWAYGSNGYFWVPGIWEPAPEVGWLWTPGYWGWSSGAYLWHGGYWGKHVGFYGGINYGYGYTGVGYEGGYWNERKFYYNTAVTKVNVTVVHNTYQKAAVESPLQKSTVNFNGGEGGVLAKPVDTERAAADDRHITATSSQKRHIHAASANPELLVSVNQGHPRAEILVKRQNVINPKKIQKPKQPPKPKPPKKKDHDKKTLDQERKTNHEPIH